MAKKPKATKNVAKKVETKSVRNELFLKLGKLNYEVGAKIAKHNKELQELQIIANGVATEIEKLDG